jgi:4-hydroxy-tetrahydrodipicolinate synthase
VGGVHGAGDIGEVRAVALRVNLQGAALEGGAEAGVGATSPATTTSAAANDPHAARAIWSGLETLVPLRSNEANPMPIKYGLWRQGMITSPECRLPLTSISRALADELDRLGHGRVKSAA